jgi:hypothetical protein
MPVTINGSAGVTTNSGAVYNSIQSGTAVTASGTSVDFTDIPSWVKRITVMFNGVSGNGSSAFIVQLGSGSVDTASYISSNEAMSGATVGGAIATTGFQATYNAAATNVQSGIMTIINVSGNEWVFNSVINVHSAATIYVGVGKKTLSGTLDRVRITTVNGTDTFDAGSINILYE